MSRTSRFVLLGFCLSALSTVGCARPVPEPGIAPRGRVPGYEWPPRTIHGDPVEVANSSSAHSAPSPILVKASSEQTSPEQARLVPLPAGPPEMTGPVDEGCLRSLASEGISYAVMDGLRGVRTPVQIDGKLGGVEYYVAGRGPLRLDCRFALALREVGPVLRRHGVLRVRFSGAYVYKTAPSGRLSHHAYGVAIDLHDFETNQGTLTVKKDFRKGAGCGRRVPPLNRIACDLERSYAFDEFLTPDFNRAHRDHFHISIPRG